MGLQVYIRTFILLKSVSARANVRQKQQEDNKHKNSISALRIVEFKVINATNCNIYTH